MIYLMFLYQLFLTSHDTKGAVSKLEEIFDFTAGYLNTSTMRKIELRLGNTLQEQWEDLTLSQVSTYWLLEARENTANCPPLPKV